MRLSIVAAVDLCGAIGFEGRLPWPRIRADMRHFRSLTMGRPVIMGRRTWESLGMSALPGRYNVVVSRSLRAERGHQWSSVPSPEAALEEVSSAPEAFAIGGAAVFSAFLPVASRLYVTHVRGLFAADAYFPAWPIVPPWVEVEGRDVPDPMPEDPFPLRFSVYERPEVPGG